MIVFAHVAGSVSIAALFLAGVIPGVMIGLSLMVASYVHGRLYHQKELPKLELREKVRYSPTGGSYRIRFGPGGPSDPVPAARTSAFAHRSLGSTIQVRPGMGPSFGTGRSARSR